MLCSIASMIVVRTKKSAAGGSDVSCTTDFTESISSDAPPFQTATKTIAGINTTITLRLNITTTSATELQYYYKNGGSEVQFFDDDTLTVVNGDTLYFEVDLTVGGDLIEFQVINQSDSNAVLGTITIERTGGGGGGG
jgi:hypothetical protein